MVNKVRVTDVSHFVDAGGERKFAVYMNTWQWESAVDFTRDQLERLAAQINVALRESDPEGANGEGK